MSEPAKHREEMPPGCGIVIFGAMGDLARRKLLASLVRLQLLFVRADGMERSWALATGVLDTWERGDACDRCLLESYPAGNAGPRAADALLQADGRRWRALDEGAKAP